MRLAQTWRPGRTDDCQSSLTIYCSRFFVFHHSLNLHSLSIWTSDPESQLTPSLRSPQAEENPANSRNSKKFLKMAMQERLPITEVVPGLFLREFKTIKKSFFNEIFFGQKGTSKRLLISVQRVATAEVNCFVKNTEVSFPNPLNETSYALPAVAYRWSSHVSSFLFITLGTLLRNRRRSAIKVVLFVCLSLGEDAIR